MNRANVQELHDTLAGLVEGERWRFDMSQWLDVGESVNLAPDPHRCGAIGCMAGWAAMLAHAQDPVCYPIDSTAPPKQVERIAQAWLGLTEAQARYWFLGHWLWRVEDGPKLERISLEDVVAFLAWVLAETVSPDSAPDPMDMPKQQERMLLSA